MRSVAVVGAGQSGAQLALGLKDRGTLEAGKRADFVLWNVREPAQLAYAIGFNPHRQTVFEGRPR